MRVCTQHGTDLQTSKNGGLDLKKKTKTNPIQSYNRSSLIYQRVAGSAIVQNKQVQLGHVITTEATWHKRQLCGNISHKKDPFSETGNVNI